MDTVRSDSGVTLLELAIVVAIVGIVAMIAVPNISSFTNKYRLTRVANDYAMSVNLARSQAIAFNRQMRVVHLHPDANPGDGSRTNYCAWDIQARYVDDDGSVYWETIPDDGVDGPDTNYSQAGYYDYDNYLGNESPDYVRYISMEESDSLVHGHCFEFTTRGTVTSGTGDCAGFSAEDGECFVRVGFRNKTASDKGRIQVCVGNPSGITTLHSNHTW